MPAPPTRPHDRAERARDHPRRRRLRAARLLRLRHRHAQHRRARRGRAALQPLPRHRAVLADARRRAHRPQPPRGRHGLPRRLADRLTRATTAASRSRRRPCRAILRDDGLHHATPSASGTSRRAASGRTSGPFDRWPLGSGFERFYGFLRATRTSGRRTSSATTTTSIRPRTPEDGYHLTEDLADQAIRPARRPAAGRAGQAVLPVLRDRRDARAAPRRRRSGSSRYRGRVRRRLGRVARPTRSRASSRRASCPTGTVLTRAPAWVPAWDELSADERAHALRAHAWRCSPASSRTPTRRSAALLDRLASVGVLDNTIVMLDLRQRRERRRRHARHAQRAPLHLAAARDRRRATSRVSTSWGGFRALQPLRLGLGVGRQHAVAAVEALHVARRHRARR